MSFLRIAVILLAAGRIGLLNAAPIAAQAQSPDTRPQFEVASIKATFGDETFIGINGSSRDFKATEASLRRLIAIAYGVRTFEIYGGPGWMDSDRYNILAKRDVSPKEPRVEKESFEATWTDLLLRLRSLLEDRCNLKLHRGTKELPVFALTVAKSGLKLQPSSCEPIRLGSAASQSAPRLPRPASCGSLQSLKSGANMITTGTGVEMKDFIHWLSITAGRTVIDKTGYAEKFNFSVEWAPDALFSPSLAAADDPAKPADTTGPSLSSALENKLGLNLKGTKGPVEILVIDQIEKPSAN